MVNKFAFIAMLSMTKCLYHYTDVIMITMASQITSLTIVYSTVYSGADQSKHQNSASLAFVWGIHRGPVNSPHKWPVTWKMFPFDDVIMTTGKMYAIFGKHNGSTRIWHFDLLEMAWHQPVKYYNFNATLTCSVMDEKSTLQCPKLKVNNMM